MKAALIPPKGLEDYILYSNFHLAIASSQCMQNPAYVSAYQEASRRGDYIVLDNGAADGGLVSNMELMTAAKLIGAHEVVAPDVFYKGPETVAKVQEFIAWMGSTYPSTKIMAVVQGTTIQELQYSVLAYSEEPRITVLGLPKHLLSTFDYKPIRLDFARWIKDLYGNRFAIHFLGTNPIWLKEIQAAEKYSSIRSVDTALPFNYALAEQDLLTTTVQLTRNPEYFDMDWSETVSERLVQKNIKTYLEWADATYVETPSFGQL